MRRALALFCASVLLATAGQALALDYLAVAEAAVLYDAPSQKAKPLHVIARGTPVEVLVAVEGWVKVRDQAGDLAWIEKRQLTDQRTVIVRVARAQIQAQAEDKAALIFEGEKDLVLELMLPVANGWARVKHRDGAEGYIRALQVWGL